MTSLSESALSAMSQEEEEGEERKHETFGDGEQLAGEGNGHPMRQSHGFQSMSSIASYASMTSPSAPTDKTLLPSLESLAASSSRYYLVVEPPLKQQLTFLLRPPHLSRDDRPPAPLAVARTRLIMRRVRWLLCGCFVLYVIVAIIRLSALKGWPSSSSSDTPSSSVHRWYVDLFYSSALLVLPLCLLPAPLYTFVLDALGNAQLLVVQEAVQARTEQGYGPSSVLGSDGEEMRERERREREKAKMGGRRRRSDSVSSVSTVSSDEGEETMEVDNDIDDHQTFTFIDSLQLSFTALIAHSMDIATGQEVWITRTVNPLLTLGTVTVFCCLDSEGILSENEPSPDHLLLFQQEKPVIVDIINDPTSPNGMMLEGEWRRHMAVLKPIGLNCALNHPCNMRDSQLCEFAFGGGEGVEEREISGCLCPLAREIGFDVKWIRQHFYVSKVLYNVTMTHRSAPSTVKQRRKGRGGVKAIKAPTNSTSSSSSDPRIRTMTSICIQDRLLPDSFHLLSNGDPLLTFNHCYAYWDGEGIKPIDAAIESSFQSIIQQWQHQDLHCIGFAYTPIPSMYYPLLLEGEREREYLIDSWEEGRGWENRRHPLPLDRLEEKDPAIPLDYPTPLPLHEDDGRGVGSGNEGGVVEDERKVGLDVESVMDDNEEVLLDEATDLVEEDGRDRRVRWGQEAEGPSDREEDGDTSEGSVIDSTTTLPSRPPLSTPSSPTTSQAVASPRHSFPLSQPAVSASASSLSPPPAASSTSDALSPVFEGVVSSTARQQQWQSLSPPSAPPAPGAPGPPPTVSSQDSGDLHISIPHSPSVASADDPQQSATDSLTAPLRRLHLHPSSSSSTPYAPTPSQPLIRSSTPSHTLSTSLLSTSPLTGGGRRSSSSLSSNVPPRPVSTPAVLYPHLHSSPAPSSLSSSQLQPLLIPPSSSAASLDPHESRSAQVRSPLLKGDGRSRASSLSHSQSSTQLGSMTATSFLPTLSHVDSPVLPFTISTPPAPTARSASPPPIILNPHNTPLIPKPPLVSSHSEPPPLTSTAGAAPFLPTSSSSVLSGVQHDQLFLGMVAMRDQPKTEVRSLVEHLMAAGIRFVFFSPENERKTQAFGGKIGLFTDFNVYISLKDIQEGAGTQRVRQGKSQLPCGVSGIREHIQKVDNVPLLVSLFTDCSPRDVKEMIRIYQENGESVMCMGSSLKVENSEAFMQADISVSLDPIPSRECKDKTFPSTTAKKKADSLFGLGGDHNSDGVTVEMEEEEGDYSDSREFAVSSKITSMPCALPLSSTTDLMQFIALICEGRRLSINVNQSLVFALCSYMALFLLLLLTFIVNTPPLFTGYQILWLVVLIIPILSFSLFFSPRSPDVMTRLADKNIDIAADSSRHVVYFLVRFVSFVLIYAAFFLVFLHSSYDSSALFSTFYWQSPYSAGALSDDPHYIDVLVAVQTYSLCIYVLALIVHSVSFVHRYESLHRLNPLKNRVWVWVAVGCWVCQVLFAMVSVLSVGRVGVDLSWYWYIWFVWPLWIVGVDELIKTHDRGRREFYHNRARSHFDTVLGMWSPK